MKIKFWGVRGSIPSPLKPSQIEEKLFEAILGMPDLDTGDPQAVRAYINSLSPLQRGTAGGNTACVEVQAGTETIIIDAGSGLRDLGLELMKGPCGRGQGTIHFLFSHAHWDHIQGFPFFVPAVVPGNRIIIYGVHDLDVALRDQQRPLNFPVSLAHMRADIEFRTIRPGEPFSIGHVRVNSIENAHPGKAYSYRLEDQHNVFVHASDAEFKQLDETTLQPYLEFFQGADILNFDAQYTLQDVWHHKIDWGHSSALIGVDLARAAGVKKLVLFHHDPTYSDAQLQEIQAAAVSYQAQGDSQSQCEIIVAYEGLSLDLTPAGTINLKLSADGRSAILTPATIFDEAGVAQLVQQLSALEDQDPSTRSIIDLSQVERLTTASLKTLVTLDLARQGETIVMVTPSPAVQQVIELAGFGDFFAIYPTIEAALTAVRAREALNLPGQRIKERYQIQNTLGAGLLGTVLKATDTESGQTIAVKMFSPSLGQETLSRFARQIPQLKNMNYAGIAQVVDWDSESDNYFVVEEFINGQSLHEIFETGHVPFPHDQMLEFVLALNEALAYAHRHGVIHGHLTPRNIYSTLDGFKFSGFGQGRLLEGRNLLETPFLHRTAAYLAPEQILGQPLDARTDLYAMGVVLYQLFTGQLPFSGSNREMMEAHLLEAPTPPRKINPEVSLAIEHLILKLLAKNPNDRYASADQAHRVVSGSAGQTVINAGHDQLLVERDEALISIERCWVEAKSGRGQLVFISGEAGIGKTSLIRKAIHQGQPPVVLIGRCHEHDEGSTYRPFAELLQTYLATAPPEFFDEETRRLLGNFLRIIPQIRNVWPDIVEPPPLDSKLEQLRLMTSLVQFIRRATERRPWLIVLESLQWADPNSLELLRYLGYHLSNIPLLLIGTYRDTEVESRHPLWKTVLDLSSGPSYSHIHLDRLNENSVSQLLAYVWQQPVPKEFTKMIYRHTAGNPFYVEEVARGLAEDGLILRRNGTWRFPVLDELRLPHSIREAVWRRVRRLNPGTQDLLRQAAVLGHSFQFEDLQALSGLTEWEVLEHLDVALERQLVQEVAGQSAFRFSQTEIQGVLYTDMNTPRRRMLHRQAGEMLEQRASTGRVQNVEVLARHFTEAGEVERALIYCYQAAQQAQTAYASPTALIWYNRTLEMFSRPGSDTVHEARTIVTASHEAMGELLTRLGRYDEALVHFDLALEGIKTLATNTDREGRLVELFCKISDVYKKRGDYGLAFDWLEQGRRQLEPNKPSLAAARLFLDGAVTYLRQGKSRQALPWSQQGLRLATQLKTTEAQQTVGQAYYILGNVYSQLGELVKAVEYCRQSVAIYRTINDQVGQSTAYLNLGITYYEQGDWVQASDAYHRSLEMKKEIGDIYGQGQVSNNLGNISMDQGDWVQAQELFKQSLLIWRDIGAFGEEANTLSNLSQLYIYRHNWAKAKSCLQRSQALFDEVGSDEFLAELERRWAEFYLKTDDTGQSLEYAIRSVERAVAHGDPFEAGVSRRMLGRVYLALRQYEQAESYLEDSLNTLAGLKSDFEIAKTRLVLAQLKAEIGHEQTARDYLTQCVTTFEKLGAQPSLTCARKLQPVL